MGYLEEEDEDLAAMGELPEADPSDPLKGKLYPYLRERAKRQKQLEQDRAALAGESTRSNQGALLAALSKGSSMMGSMGGKMSGSSIVPEMNKQLGGQFQEDFAAEQGLRKSEDSARRFEEDQDTKRQALYAKLKEKKAKTFKQTDYESNGSPLLLDSEGNYSVGNVPPGAKRIERPNQGMMGYGNIIPGVLDASGNPITFNQKTGQTGTVALPAGATNTKDNATKKSDEEGAYRFNMLNTNLDKLKGLVDKHGTFDVLGPEGDEMDSLIYQAAVDYAKLVDPDSVAREGEVASAQKYMLKFRQKSGLTTAKDTALSQIDSYKTSLADRMSARQASRTKPGAAHAPAGVGGPPPTTKDPSQMSLEELQEEAARYAP